tara:strand:+ start:1188 stop:1439 length:252 start_codon:yes stop_codon:yes gene_type:complete
VDKLNYIIFCKPTCPFCTKAIKLLEDKEKTFKVVDFREGQDQVLSEIKEAMSWPTVPMVFHRDGAVMTFIGGYTDLVKHLDNV